MLVFASYGYAQQVNLRQESMTVEQLFKQIKKQTEKDIMLSSTSLNVQSMIDINQQGEVDLSLLLNTYFNDKTGFIVKNTGNTIIIGETAGRKGSLQGQVISKKTKLPLADVNVRINNLEQSIRKTDNEGFFVLPTYATVKELQFSFIGYKKAKINTIDKFFYVIELEEEGETIDDVVITGIYQRKKESFTGSAATYTAKELKMVGNQNVLQSLKTLDPSFQIMESNLFGSDPNRLPDLEINGKSSVIGISNEYGGNLNQPLFILDGFESSLSVINDFSMDRIESITILKDASATAIYGSKAANGVIVVETKRPKPGELKINYSANASFSFADLTDYNLMNAREKIDFELKSGYYGVFNSPGNNDYEREYYNILKVLRIFGPSWSTADKDLISIPYYKDASREIAPLSSSEEIRALILADLELAQDLLRNSDPILTEGVNNVLNPDGSNVFNLRQYRLNYYAVQALLARVYLWSGNTEKAGQIASQTIAAVQQPGKEIFPFVTAAAASNGSDPDRLFSSEVMFALYTVNRTNMYNTLFSPAQEVRLRLAPNPGNTIMTRVDAMYDDKNDYRYKIWENASLTGISLITNQKYKDYTNSPSRYMIPLIRLSELYLIAAECSPNLTEASDYINTVRAKRNSFDLTLTDQAAMERTVASEFRREFIGEGQQFFYYKRKRYTEVPNHTGLTGNKAVAIAQYRVPLPDSEISLRNKTQ